MISLILASTLIVNAAAAGFKFTYDAQDQWPGVCVVGNQMRQSPINIVTSNVQADSTLFTSLKFSYQKHGMNGIFRNTGHNVQFDPDVPGSASFTNHLGTYLFQQVHMHWGKQTGEGSEHRIDGNQGELEIHFVHIKEGATDVNQPDYYSVIGVLADVDSGQSISGPWNKLNANAVQTFGSQITVKKLHLKQLLPQHRDYYFYQGSLTTPPCSETVAWFVMKERITVPSAYLTSLRNVEENAAGDILGYNFRMPQNLAGRVVYSN